MCFGKVFKSRFARDNRGATAVIFGLTLIPAIGIMGIAVDGWRAFNVSTLTMGALDAAALAAAKGVATENLSESEAQRQGKDYFNANFKGGAYGATLKSLQIVTDPSTQTATFRSLRLSAKRIFTASLAATLRSSSFEQGLHMDPVTSSMMASSRSRLSV